MIKTSDFARMQGVTPRAVRKLLQTYASELEGHYEKKGQNGTWIDDFSQEFLRSKMLQNPTIVYDSTTAPLFQENQALNAKVDQLKDALSEAYRELANERAKGNETLLQLQIELAEYRLLAAGREEAEQKASELEARAKEAESVNEALIDQANKAKARAEAAEKRAKEAGDRELEAELTREKVKKDAAELKADFEKCKAAMEEYSKLPAWKRLFVKPPKVEE